MQTSEIYDATIAVVTVNYRTAALVIKGLEALFKERDRFPNLHAIIVDNSSPDDSLAVLNAYVLEQSWHEWVKVVPAEKNGGYAYGNNVGFDIAREWLPQLDYVWMLNPDTEVLPGATASLINFLMENPKTIAGSRLQDRDGTPQVSTFNFPSAMSELCSGLSLGFIDRLFSQYQVCRAIPDEPEASDWMAGASLMFASSTLEILGYLDDEYFLYFEEVDYLLNAQKQGVQCWYVPSSQVIHEVGASTGISDVRKQQPRRPVYWFESRRRYFIKNQVKSNLYYDAANLL